MIVQDAIQKSKPGVAERTDSKGQRWAVWMDGRAMTGRIYKNEGDMLPLTQKTAEMLKDWTAKDPKEASITDAKKPSRPIWPK